MKNFLNLYRNYLIIQNGLLFHQRYELQKLICFQTTFVKLYKKKTSGSADIFCESSFVLDAFPVGGCKLNEIKSVPNFSISSGWLYENNWQAVLTLDTEIKFLL